MDNSAHKIRRNLLKNSLGILVGRVLTLLVSFISVPIIVTKLGISGYGTWETIVAVSALCNIFQGVITGTLLWLISNAYGANNTKQVHQYIRMGVFVALVMFLLVTPVVWHFRTYLVQAFKVAPQYVHVAEWVLPCIVGLALLGSLNQIMGTVIGGYQRAGATTLTMSVANIINYGLVIICLLLGLGFWSLLVGFGSGFVFTTIGLHYIAQRIAGPFSLLPLVPSRKVATKVAPYVGFMLLGVLSMGLRDQTDKIILTSVASPAWAGYYGIAARLAGIVTMACTFFYIPTIATSGALHSQNDDEAINRVYNDVITMSSFLVGIIVVFIAGLHDRLIFLWFGRLIPETEGLIYFLVIGTAVAVILTGAGTAVCKGTGRIRIETIYIIIGLLLNILLKFILVPMVGAIGTVVASSISWGVSSIVFVYLLHKSTNMPIAGTVCAIKILFVMGVAVIFSRWLSMTYPVESVYSSVVISTIILGIISSSFYILLIFALRIIPVKSVLDLRTLFKDQRLP